MVIDRRLCASERVREGEEERKREMGGWGEGKDSSIGKVGK